MWVYLAWTLIMIPYQALSAEVSEYYHVKTHFTAAHEAFSIIGVVTVLVMPFVLSNPQDYRALFELLYPLLALALAVGLAFPILDWSGWEARTETSLSMLVWLYAGVPIAIKLLVLLWLRGAR